MEKWRAVKLLFGCGGSLRMPSLNVGKLLLYTFGSKRRLEAVILVVQRDPHERAEFGIEQADTALADMHPYIHPPYTRTRTAFPIHTAADRQTDSGWCASDTVLVHTPWTPMVRRERRNPFPASFNFSCLRFSPFHPHQARTQRHGPLP